MNVLTRAACAFAVCAAVTVLAGCGGSASAIGSAGLSADRGILPLTTTVVYTTVHAGKPFEGALVWLRKYDEKTGTKGAYIRTGKTDAKGEVKWSGFKLDQGICLGVKAEIKLKDGTDKFSDELCYLPGYLPLKRTWRV